MARRAKRRKKSRHLMRLDFVAIEVIGGLLPPEMITQIATSEAAGDTSKASGDTDKATGGTGEQAGYGIPRGRKLKDEIARYYEIAHAHWESFEAIRTSNASAPIGFVQSLLKECFGFDTLAESAGKEIAERQFPVNFAAENGRIPVVIAPATPDASRKPGIDEALPQFGDETRRRSATELLQEYLNADENALWGIACDGTTLRIMRDNASLTRPAWIEASLEKIFVEGLFSDFSALWLILHASRFGVEGTNPSDCPLEHWKERSRIDGAVAKERLRLGVEAALTELGRGFLQEAGNTELRKRLRSGELTKQAYYEELLRLVYRLIFLFAAEDRDLLHASSTPAGIRKAYLGGYSLNRLRERCIRPASLDKNIDTWEGMKSLFKALAEGQPALGLVALGGLFEPEKIANLTGSKIENRRFLKAIWDIAWFRPEGQSITRVNWRGMKTEELGSVYESLLELIPELNLDARSFAFAAGDAAKGNARKVSGSYYTPDSLVELLLDKTLNPVLDDAEAKNPSDPVAAILKLSIIDPACGSGHFLLGAARLAADRIARYRMPGANSKEVFQHALREVVSNCIYGSDRNPMAVELCKVALWIEALEPGKPLSFLDARIKCGDSLVGVFDYRMLKQGIPDGAYAVKSGDDRIVAKAYQRLNKAAKKDMTAPGLFRELTVPAEIVSGASQVAAMPEDTLRQVKAKARAFAEYEASVQWKRLKLACDMYVAAFFAAKTGDVPTDDTLIDMPVPTTGTMWNVINEHAPSDLLLRSATEVAEKNYALHWPLAFPAVMAQRGFDAVVGNPPWEQIQLDPGEWFASRDMRVTNAENMAEKEKIIKQIKGENPPLYKEYQAAKPSMEASQIFIHKSGRFPASSVGRLNTAPCFVELALDLTPEKFAGVIAPTGIATDSFNQYLFQKIVNNNRLRYLIDFENRDGLFPGVHRSFKFSVFAFGPAEKAKFAYFLAHPNMYEERDRRLSLSVEDIKRINPNTLTAPVFRSEADAELTARIYSKIPVLIQKRKAHLEGDMNPWDISFQLMFMMNTDSVLFRGSDELGHGGFSRSGSDWEHSDGRRYVPLYEGKMIHHYDHRWATYEGRLGKQPPRDVTLAEKQDPTFEPTPRYWVPEDKVELGVSRVPTRLKSAFKKEDAEGCLKVMAGWVLGAIKDLNIYGPISSFDEIQLHLLQILGPKAVSSTVVGKSLKNWINTSSPRSTEIQRYTPLMREDIAFIRDWNDDDHWLQLVGELIERKKPRWLMGWRNITNSTNERTVVGGMLPTVGVGNSLPIWSPGSRFSARQVATLCGMLTSITFDFIARQKLGGSNFNFFIAAQLPVLSPDSFTTTETECISRKVLELTYTSHAMRPWAADLGYTGSPFCFNPDRRAQLRAELDAFFAKKYGLTEDELRYVLDPQDVKGENYPSETFKRLKKNEIEEFGEYRTQRLVLAEFDRITR